jgi:hypothetical protein
MSGHLEGSRIGIQRSAFWSVTTCFLIARQQAAPGSDPAYQLFTRFWSYFRGLSKRFPNGTKQGENTSGVVLGSRLPTSDKKARRHIPKRNRRRFTCESGSLQASGVSETQPRQWKASVDIHPKASIVRFISNIISVNHNGQKQG